MGGLIEGVAAVRAHVLEAHADARGAGVRVGVEHRRERGSQRLWRWPPLALRAPDEIERRLAVDEQPHTAHRTSGTTGTGDSTRS